MDPTEWDKSSDEYKEMLHAACDRQKIDHTRLTQGITCTLLSMFFLLGKNGVALSVRSVSSRPPTALKFRLRRPGGMDMYWSEAHACVRKIVELLKVPKCCLCFLCCASELCVRNKRCI
jgi:hypothetical protein